MSALPDYVGAMIAHLRSLAAVTALCPATRIVGELPGKNVGSAGEAGVMPTYAIAVVNVPGGFGSDLYVPLARPRLDLFCYGKTGLEAMNLWRTVQSQLEPPTRQGCNFTAAGCRVLDVQCVMQPARQRDPITQWPYAQAGYILTINEVAVA